jgi:hypothetical protein
MKSWDTTTIASLKSLTLGARVEWSEVWLRFCVERLSRYLDIELSDGCLENSGDCLESILLSNFNEHSFRTLFGIRCHSDKVEELFSERFEICKFTSFIAKYGARPLMTQYPNGIDSASILVRQAFPEVTNSTVVSEVLISSHVQNASQRLLQIFFELPVFSPPVWRVDTCFRGQSLTIDCIFGSIVGLPLLVFPVSFPIALASSLAAFLFSNRFISPRFEVKRVNIETSISSLSLDEFGCWLEGEMSQPFKNTP